MKDQEISELLRDLLGEDQINYLRHMSKLGNTCSAIHAIGSVDEQRLIMHIYTRFEKQVSIDMIQEIVTEYVQVLRDEGLLDENDQLTLDGMQIAQLHDITFGGTDSIPTSTRLH
jgi:hypothetical protein